MKFIVFEQTSKRSGMAFSSLNAHRICLDTVVALWLQIFTFTFSNQLKGCFCGSTSDCGRRGKHKSVPMHYSSGALLTARQSLLWTWFAYTGKIAHVCDVLIRVSRIQICLYSQPFDPVFVFK